MLDSNKRMWSSDSLLEMSSSVSSEQIPAVTFSCLTWAKRRLGWTSDSIRMCFIRQQVGCEQTTPVLNEVCSHGEQPAKPAAMEVRVSGLHTPHPPPLSATPTPTQRCFSGKTISKLLYSAANAAAPLFVWGEGSTAGRETAGTATSTTARSPFWRGYLVTDILIPMHGFSV